MPEEKAKETKKDKSKAKSLDEAKSMFIKDWKKGMTIQGNVSGTGLGGTWEYDKDADESTLVIPPTQME